MYLLPSPETGVRSVLLGDKRGNNVSAVTRHDWSDFLKRGSSNLHGMNRSHKGFSLKTLVQIDAEENGPCEDYASSQQG
jgi:hypothetical protein